MSQRKTHNERRIADLRHNLVLAADYMRALEDAEGGDGIDPHPVEPHDEQPRDDDRERAHGVGEVVQEGRADVHAVLRHGPGVRSYPLSILHGETAVEKGEERLV